MPQALYTLYDLLPGAADGESFAGLPATMAVTLPGQPIPQLSPPFTATPTLQAAGSAGLNVLATFSEGRPGAYTVSEIWLGYDEVWIQPLYVLVTDWDEAGGHFLEGAKPIFGVGAKTRFYSPFWQVFFVEVPVGTAKDKYRSAAQLLSDGLVMHEGPGKFCPLSPAPIRLAAPESAPAPVRPITGELTGTVRTGVGWADGEQVYYLDNGADRFVWDERGVVEETALFVLATRGPDGEPAPLGLPNISGIGPLYAGRSVVAPSNRPRFGSLWRAHLVVVPQTAEVFVPSTLAPLATALAASGVRVRGADPAIEARPDVLDYALRMALHPECLDDAALFPDGCGFLDSQAAVEGQIGASNILRTPMLVTCPFVEFDGRPVPN